MRVIGIAMLGGLTVAVAGCGQTTSPDRNVRSVAGNRASGDQHGFAEHSSQADHHGRQDDSKRQRGDDHGHHDVRDKYSHEKHSGESSHDDRSTGSAPDHAGSTEENSSSRAPLAVFRERILPILQADKPSSCTECHLSGVDLKDYIHPDQAKTFAALREQGLIDVEEPDESKLLEMIAMKPDESNGLISADVRRKEYEAFRAWITAAVDDPQLLDSTAPEGRLGPEVPPEVIRHARRDRVLASFIDRVWSEIARCSGCHSPKFNRKQVKKHGQRVSWIKLDDPEGTMRSMAENGLINPDAPEKSLLLLKPTAQVEHGGGRKIVVGDRTWKQFRRFIEDYAAVVNGDYKSSDELPEPSDEISVATSMKNGIWFKLTGVPERFGGKLLRVDLYRRTHDGWSATRWATADRLVAGDRRIWQQTLSLTAPRGSPRAERIRHAQKLPPGEYLVKIYVDRKNKLNEDPWAKLDEQDFVGQTVVDSQWPRRYGSMTVVDFPRP